ncbi:serine/threonine protein kinase [Leptolyngbya sp. GB1-A1]|uniref:serine/threonine-protein kinase n=1 Tax=Leptolyngbya sp. GB1-A1 TaxID=2933908 RepID=UPI00329875FA
MIGKTLSGRYSIIQRLGGGGFSDTYLAVDKQLPTVPRCVVKRLKSKSPDTATLKTVRRLFNAEATTLYELGRRSDRIPRLLAHFEEDEEFYLVQEFVEGHDLSHELAYSKRLSEAEVIAMISDILSVLQFVHRQGVIHRDIKPRNLIRRQEDGRIVLIDFGAVKQISTEVVHLQAKGQTSVTIAIGTPGYMPNEQQGGKPRFNSDIYAVGMVAVQALTGLPPHELQEDFETGEVIWREQTQVSQEFGDVVDKMVRTHFIDRYKSVEEVLFDLRQLQDVVLQGVVSEETVIYDPATVPGTLPSTLPDPVEPFPTALGDSIIKSSTGATGTGATGTGVTSTGATRTSIVSTSIARRWQLLLSLNRFVNRWALVGVTLASTFAGYGYWRFQAIPSSRALTTQFLPAQPPSSSQGSSQNSSQNSLQNSSLFTLANTLAVHRGAVDAIAMSPDGKTFVSGSEDNTVKLWDSQTGALLQTFSGHTAEVVAVTISRDGGMLATGSRDNTVRLWDLNTGKLIHTLNHPDWVSSVAFSPDGKMLASGNYATTVSVWNTKTGELLCDFEGHSQPVKSVAISPDGKLLAAGSEDQTIRVWSLETEKRVHTLDQHAGAVESVAMSPDGQILITGGTDETLIWNLKTGKVVQTLPEQSGFVRSLVVSPDGTTLVSSHEDNTIKLWNLQTGALLNTLPGHQDWVLSLALSPDGKTLISGSRDKAIKIWRL